MGEFKPDQKVPQRSLSHPFHGGFDAWFYQGVAGIELDPSHQGFKHIIFRPGLIKELFYARATYRSLYGKIKSSWECVEGVFSWDVVIPANTTATIYIPANDAKSVTERGQPAAKAKGVKFLRMEPDAAVCELSSGSYTFESSLMNRTITD